ncbi:MAG: CPBP family glutamic-type intramembrane protease [Defluviitaleaceae bacterium]|nr:CPBP family glutamic-type intramembrane protease [Defluviitaleaceae bacterium]
MNSLYSQEVSKCNKKDAIIAIGFFVYFIIRDFAVSIIYSQFNISGGEWRILIGITCIIDILIVFAIVKIRKQNLASIGLHKKNIWSALGLGLLFAPIFILQRIMQGGVVGWELYSFGSFMVALMNITLWAVREDISFVGFIQTRLHGLVKNDFWAVNLGAALFVLAHVPSRLIQGIPMGYIIFILLLANWFFMYRAFVLLFKRYYSLIPVFIMHIASNFPRLWQGDGITDWLWIAVPTAVFVLAVEFWYGRWSKSHTDDVGERIIP